MDKPIVWMGGSFKDLCSMPKLVKREIGHALSEAQAGRKAAYTTPMKGNLRDVMEIGSDYDGDTYRGMYTTKLEGRIYVLDVFQKKSKSGIATPKADLDRIMTRLKAARKFHREYLL